MTETTGAFRCRGGKLDMIVSLAAQTPRARTQTTDRRRREVRFAVDTRHCEVAAERPFADETPLPR